MRFEQHGTVVGTAHAGELLLGFHAATGQFEHCCVDSFHTGTAMMWSVGAPQEDGVVAVTGSYLAGPERWGWRTEFALGDGLTTRAFNVTPDGEESLAIETQWTR